jgi:DNA-binding transcriptional ArsR family regulator
MSKDTTKELLDNMLHPVRMRVLMSLAANQGMTPLQIAEQLSDVPQATLYRHINRLAKAGLLQVVDERQVRGTLEKVYALNRSSHTHLGSEDIAHLTKEDHLHYFTAFMISMLDQYSRYLNHRSKIDLAADGVGYNQVLVFMTDEELAQFSNAFNQLLLPHLQPSDAKGNGLTRKKRILATIMMPEISGEKKGNLGN